MPGNRPQDAVLTDMQRFALRSEFGASYIYPALARMARDRELKGVLDQLHLELVEQIVHVRELMTDLGGKPARGRFRRWVAAWALALCTPLIGIRFPLRLCQAAASSASRWYADYARDLALMGKLNCAERSHRFSITKKRHAQILQTWVEHLPHRRFARD